ncbi:TetR family transcriptional regulator [Streptomyces tsukubensis]|uniref:TetR/AcrR family transcriptional regulator n=1 Tax=Streptomyces tsukubensis TaxID=83656 RepID=UPI001265E844|nr:TetR/AcrR family transcriptional regulator [Streptomyces tsukubensis]QFR95716.1 TetR family transcriptional regulator [Streptomyces tsukubensis]
MTTAKKRNGGGMSEQRRLRLRLEISREAARLFWEQGVAATSGDQIAEAGGLSTRTIWRHFRSKESCAEPIVMQGVVTLLSVMRSWPRQSSLEEHLTTELTRLRHEEPPVPLADEMLAMKMIRLADTEPALRTAWLMACDQTEREMCVIIGDRLQRPSDDLDVRMYATSAAGVIRVLDEHIGAAILAGADLAEFNDVTAVSQRYAHAIRTATGGVVGEPVA